MRLILIGLLLTVTSAQAAWLHRCPASHAPSGTPGSVAEALVTDPGGEQQRIIVSNAPAVSGCRSVALPVPTNAIAAIRPIASVTADSIRDLVVLQGSEHAGGYAISEVIIEAKSPAPTQTQTLAPAPMPMPVPLRENLLTGMTARTFGVEERTQARIADGSLTLQCAAGNKPAGVVLTAAWSMPRANLRLQLSGSASGSFELLVADAASAAREAATRLGDFDAGSAPNARNYLVQRAGFDPGTWRSIAIACPAGEARMELDALRLTPQPRPAPPRASWIWNANLWQKQAETVFQRAQKYGIGVLFVSVPQSAGAVTDPVALSAFIRGAASRGLEVWAVDGDPHMVMPREQAASAERARAYAAYNASVDATARLGGVQFDVEPYLLPGHELAPLAWDRRYLELARALHKAVDGMPLELVVPFWWADKPELLRAAAPFVTGLSVMDYRTDVSEIYRFAIPFLEWGQVHAKKVRIALEAGPVGVESQRRYTRAGAGELWLLKLGQAHLLLLLKQARSNPQGPAFRMTATSTFDGSATSFHRNPARLLGLLPGLEQDFSAWDAFQGIALHELN